MSDMLRLGADGAMPGTSPALKIRREASCLPCGSRASDLAAAIHAAQARAPGLTLTQLLVFLTVAAEEGLRLSDLGARTSQSQANVSRSVAILTATGHRGSRKRGYGLLTLFGDGRDGRARRAALTDSGRYLLARIQASHPS